jgi:hypothetical protein
MLQRTAGGRWFAIFWLLVSTVIFAKVVSSGMDTYLQHRCVSTAEYLFGCRGTP